MLKTQFVIFENKELVDSAIFAKKMMHQPLYRLQIFRSKFLPTYCQTIHRYSLDIHNFLNDKNVSYIFWIWYKFIWVDIQNKID